MKINTREELDERIEKLYDNDMILDPDYVRNGIKQLLRDYTESIVPEKTEHLQPLTYEFAIYVIQENSRKLLGGSDE